MRSQHDEVAAVSTEVKRTDKLPRFSGLHDTHCHVDLFPKPTEVVRRAELARVYTIGVTTVPSCFVHMERLTVGSKYVRPALGFHPELVRERVSELPIFLGALARTRYVGEIGLDYTTPERADRITQRRVLDEIVSACDAAGDKILTVHSRRAADDVVDVFGASFRGKFILHWYSGGLRTLRRAIANGAYISVNLAMLRSDRSRAIVCEVPRDRVLIESDGPFVHVRTTSRASIQNLAGPERAVDVAAALAGLWDTDPASSATMLSANFCRLLLR